MKGLPDHAPHGRGERRSRPRWSRQDAAQVWMASSQRHARWRALTDSETAAAAAELQEIASGRADLLAEVAGILAGFHEGELDEPKAKAAAYLCRLAGADESLIPAVDRGGTAPGRGRAEAAVQQRARKREEGRWRRLHFRIANTGRYQRAHIRGSPMKRRHPPRRRLTPSPGRGRAGHRGGYSLAQPGSKGRSSRPGPAMASSTSDATNTPDHLTVTAPSPQRHARQLPAPSPRCRPSGLRGGTMENTRRSCADRAIRRGAA
jgi:hypothetical protein